MQDWYVIFEKNRTLEKRYYHIQAYSRELAQKRALDTFGKDWSRVLDREYFEHHKRELGKVKLIEIDDVEAARYKERKSRIPYIRQTRRDEGENWSELSS